MSDFQNLFAALAKAQGDMDTLIASSTAAIKSDKAAYSYKYADLADVLKIALKTLSKHGLGIIQIPEVQFAPDGAIVSISATLFHASGEFIPIAPLCLRVRSGATAQEVGSGITYARRYQLQSVLGMAADDDDGAAATQSANKRQQPAQPAHRALPAQPAPPPADNLPTTLDDLPEMEQAPPAEDDSLFDKPATNSKPLIGKSSLATLHALGVAFYGDQWDTERHRLVDLVTKGAESSSAKLTANEGATLISGLEKKIRTEYGDIAKALGGSGDVEPLANVAQLGGVKLADAYNELRRRVVADAVTA